MAVPYERVRLVLEGTIDSGQSWSFGITVAPEGTGFDAAMNQANLDEWAGNRVVNFRDALNTVATGFLPLRTLMNTATQATGLTAYYIPPNSDSSSLMSTPTFGSPIVGNGSGTQSAQTCLVASLRTITPGRTGRGRLYLPATGVVLGANCRVQASTVTPVAKQVAQLLSAINNSSLGNVAVRTFVASTAGKRPITSVQVDNRPDVQRRRADKILATETGVAAVTNT